MKLFHKLITCMIIISIVPALIIGLIAVDNINQISNTILINTEKNSQLAIYAGGNALTELGKDMIHQKATDVAKQVDVYLKSNPDMTLADLYEDDEFWAIAVQPVGEEGYTAIHDPINMEFMFYIKEEFIGTPTVVDEVKLPEYATLVKGIKGGHEVSGYYNWKDPDGMIRQKYLSFIPVSTLTKDGRMMEVAATYYTDEFSKPMKELESEITSKNSEIIADTEEMYKQAIATILIITLISAILAMFLGIYIARDISSRIGRLKRGTEEMEKGNLAHRTEIAGDDEISALSGSFDNMATNIQQNIAKINEDLTQQQTVNSEIMQIVDAVNNGDLKKRLDPDIHKGEYQLMISGINSILDAYGVPLRETVRIADQFAECNFTARFNPKIKLKGDFIAIGEHLNHVGKQVSEVLNVLNNKIYTLQNGTEEVRLNIDELSNNFEEISKGTEAVSKQAEETKNSTNQISQTLEDMHKSILNTSNKIQTVSQSTTKSYEITVHWS